MSKAIDYLLRVIDELSKLDTLEKRASILSKFKETSYAQNTLISDLELDAIIKFLVSKFQDPVYLYEFKQIEAFNGPTFTKEETRLARTIAVSLDPQLNVYKIHVLTNKKYYDAKNNRTSRYPSNNQNVVLGRGSFKILKADIVFICGKKLIVESGARAALRLHDFKTTVNDTVMIDANHKLKTARTLDAILNILDSLESKSEPNISLPYWTVLTEVKISRQFAKHKNFIGMQICNPVLKHSKGGNWILKVHLFATRFSQLITLYPTFVEDAYINIINKKYPFYDPRNLLYFFNAVMQYKINIPFVKIIDQLLHVLVVMQANGVIHRDIKVENLMVFNYKNKNVVVVIDFGAAINVKDSVDLHKQLLTNLYPSRNVDPGENQDRLLQLPIGRSMLRELQLSKGSMHVTLSDYVAEMLSGPLVYETPHATYSYASPEVLTAFQYSQDDIAKYPCLGSDVINKLSVASRTQLPLQVNHKHDVWAMGIAILLLIFKQRQTLQKKRTIATIMLNPWLLMMLHPDIEQRCKATQVQEAWRQNPNMYILPLQGAETSIDVLAARYENLITDLDRKLLLRGSAAALPTEQNVLLPQWQMRRSPISTNHTPSYGPNLKLNTPN